MCRTILILFTALIIFLACPMAQAELRADLNKDGRVDMLDLSIMASEWLMADYYLEFGGSSFVSFPRSPVLAMGLQDFSVSFWVKPVLIGDSGSVIAHLNPGATLGWWIWLKSDLQVETELIWGLATTGVNGFTAHPPLSTATWSNVVITYDRSDVAKLYVNGSYVISLDISGLEAKDITQSESLFSVGAQYDIGAFQYGGDLDEVRVYQGKILSQAEITEIYNNGDGRKARDIDFLITDGWYTNMDDGEGLIVSGRRIAGGSPTDHNGTISDPNDILWSIGGMNGAGMTIAKSAILNSVDSRLNLDGSVTDIDTDIVKIIQKVVSLVPGISEKTDTVTIANAAYSGTLPDGFVAGVAVTNSSGQPLEWVEHIADLMVMKRSNTTAGDPESFSIFGNSLYVHPTSSGGHTLTVFEEYEDSSADAITLPDCAEEALIEGVCMLKEEERGVPGLDPDQIGTHERLFNSWILSLQARYARRKG